MSLRRRSGLLLALGLLAVALHVLAGSGLMRMGGAAGEADRFVAELCTSHGVLPAASLQTPGEGSAPAGAVHDCCKLCAAGAPLLAAEMAVGVPPAPTLAAPPLARDSAQRTLVVRAAHPPRGPPARA